MPLSLSRVPSYRTSKQAEKLRQKEMETNPRELRRISDVCMNSYGNFLEHGT